MKSATGKEAVVTHISQEREKFGASPLYTVTLFFVLRQDYRVALFAFFFFLISSWTQVVL